MAHDLPIYQPEKLSGSEEEWHSHGAFGADGTVTRGLWMLILANSYLISMDRVENVHASILPKEIPWQELPIHYRHY